jgi:hypothetical protein
MISGLSLLAACATSTTENISVQPPSSWVIQFEGEDTQCHDFDKKYINKGERQIIPKKDAHNFYLSELMFSRLQGGRLPNSIEIATDIQSGQLSVTLIGDTTRNLRYEIACDSGWHVLRKSRNGQYLGDGVVEKQYDQISFFRIGDKGELIVRVLMDAEFNSMYLFNSGVHADEWYRFRPVSKSQ